MRVSTDVNNVICGVSKLRTICRYILEEKIKEYTEKGPLPDDILHHVITANQMYLEHVKTEYDSHYKVGTDQILVPDWLITNHVT